MATAKNPEVTFPSIANQASVDNARLVSHLTFWRESGRTNWLGELDITDSPVVTPDQAIKISANVIVWTIPTPTNGSLYAAYEALRGVVGPSVYIDAHYSSPGSNHTANRFSQIGQIGIPLEDWVLASS